MSDGGIATAQVGAVTVQSNSVSSEALVASLKPQSDKAASDAASQLGKRGGKAAAEARAAKQDESTAADEVNQSEQQDQPAKVIKPIPDKAEDSQDGNEPSQDEKPEDQPKDHRGDPRHDPKARMLEATRQAAEAKRALAEERERSGALEARLAALERLAEGLRGQEPPQRQPEPKKGKPKPEDHETYEEYLDARDAYNREQWENEGRQRAEQDGIGQALDRQRQEFAKAVESASISPDQIAPEVGHLKTSFQLLDEDPEARPDAANWIADALFFTPESAPALMVYLSAHTDELQRIVTLKSPHAVSRALAKIEARLDAAPTATSAKEDSVSTAAPPVRPVTGKPYVSESEYRPGMSMDEYYAMRKKQSRSR